MKTTLWCSRLAILFGVVALNGCAQHGGALPASPGTFAAPDISPPGCKGQVTKKDYATATAELKPTGGEFCVPAFAGYGGDIEYPAFSGSGSVKLVLTSNTKNVKHEPDMGSGAPIFYLEFSIGQVAFGTTLKSKAGVTGNAIKVGQSYTAYGQAVIGSEKIVLGPCYTVATKGKYGGVIGGLGSLIEGRNVPTTATGAIEIYPGQAISTKC